MSWQTLVQSRKFGIVLILVGVLVLVLVSFSLGMAAGIHKARFSYAWGENYAHNMGDSRCVLQGDLGSSMMNGQRDMDDLGGYRNAHGVSGTVISVMDTSLVVRDRDDRENTVGVTDQTVIRRQQDVLKLGDIRPNDQVAVVGRPGAAGVVDAEFIRVFPSRASLPANVPAPVAVPGTPTD